jgi:hypothetical protein
VLWLLQRQCRTATLNLRWRGHQPAHAVAKRNLAVGLEISKQRQVITAILRERELTPDPHRQKLQVVRCGNWQTHRRVRCRAPAAHRTPDSNRPGRTLGSRDDRGTLESAPRCSGVLDNENAGAGVPAFSAHRKAISMLLSAEGASWSKPLAREDCAAADFDASDLRRCDHYAACGLRYMKFAKISS